MTGSTGHGWEEGGQEEEEASAAVNAGVLGRHLYQVIQSWVGLGARWKKCYDGYRFLVWLLVFAAVVAGWVEADLCGSGDWWRRVGGGSCPTDVLRMWAGGRQVVKRSRVRLLKQAGWAIRQGTECAGLCPLWCAAQVVGCQFLARQCCRCCRRCRCCKCCRWSMCQLAFFCSHPLPSVLLPTPCPTPLSSLLRALPCLTSTQSEGVEFGLRHHGRCLIADEMGVGKTVQGIALSSCYRVSMGDGGRGLRMGAAGGKGAEDGRGFGVGLRMGGLLGNTGVRMGRGLIVIAQFDCEGKGGGSGL